MRNTSEIISNYLTRLSQKPYVYQGANITKTEKVWYGVESFCYEKSAAQILKLIFEFQKLVNVMSL